MNQLRPIAHTLDLFQPLVYRVSNTIFGETNMEFRDLFIRVSETDQGLRIYSVGFTSKTFDIKDNYEVGEFFGDTLIHQALANYMIKCRFPGLTPAVMTESQNYIASKSGQWDMFKDWKLGQYLRVGSVFLPDYDPEQIDLHTYSDLVESLFYIIYEIGQLMGNIGSQLTQNFFTAVMNQHRTVFLERLTKSWKAQLEADVGKHYGSFQLLEEIKKSRDKSAYDQYLRFKLSSERLDDGQNRVTILMDSGSATDINQRTIQYPVLNFDQANGLPTLDAHQVSDTNVDEEYATSEAYKKMVNYFNSRGHNYGWRVLFSRLNELVIKMNSAEGSAYQAVIEQLIQSARFPYAKETKLANIRHQRNITYIRIEYLKQPYKIVDGNIFDIVDQLYYRHDNRVQGIIADPVIYAYVQFFNDLRGMNGDAGQAQPPIQPPTQAITYM